MKPRMKSLSGESEGIHVRNVICDDPESENYEAELAEATSGFECRAKESTDGVPCVAFRESGSRAIDSRHHDGPESLEKDRRLLKR